MYIKKDKNNREYDIDTLYNIINDIKKRVYNTCESAYREGKLTPEEFDFESIKQDIDTIITLRQYTDGLDDR